MAYVEANGQRIHYRDTGGHGPPILFSHGFMMDLEMWAPQVEVFEDRYRCITWDERCWGQTVTDGATFDYWDSAADGVAILDALGIERAVWCGMSQGGFLSLRAALAHPGRVRALVLIDTAPTAELPETATLFQAMYDQTLEEGTTEDSVDAVCSLLFGPAFDPGRWRAKMTARPPVAIGPAVDSMIGRDDVSDRLGEITCPSLVLHGEVDAVFPVDAASEWAERLGGPTTFVPIPGAGHTANLENPDAVDAAMADFLRGLDS